MQVAEPVTSIDQALILYVENDPLDVLALRRSFAALNVSPTIEVTDTAERALSKLSDMVDRLPDLMIVDLRMPGIGGLDLLKSLQADDQWRRIPAIVFSTSALERDKSEALSLGATDYVVKGMEDNVYDELKIALERALSIDAS